MASVQRFFVIGNPENRRVEFFQRALERFDLPLATVLSYEALLRGDQHLDELWGTPSWLRLESPGENFAVEKALLALGAASAENEGGPHLPAEQVERLTADRGLVLYPRQWFLGFRRLLKGWAAQLAATLPMSPGVIPMNHPDEIVVMFDKCHCHALLQAAGIPVPESLAPVRSYEELRSRMRDAGWQRVFVKIAHGSSASGVAAFEVRGRYQRATTTAQLVRQDGRLRLYNSLRLSRYTAEHEIAELIDALCAHRVHVERWLPKAKLDGKNFDLRVVAIAGRARHLVVRTSDGPLTNLHLGNRRGDPGKLLRAIGEPAWESIQETCQRVMRQFPRCLYAGIDVAVSPNLAEHFVLEVNAFGDLLPGVEITGQDTYTAQVAALLDR